MAKIDHTPIKVPEMSVLRKNLNLYTECGLDKVYSYGLLLPHLWFFDSVILYGANEGDVNRYFTKENFNYLLERNAVFFAARNHSVKALKNKMFYQNIFSSGKYIIITQSANQGERTKQLVEQDIGKTLQQCYMSNRENFKEHVFEEYNPNSKTAIDTGGKSEKEWTYSFFSNVDVKLSLLNEGISVIEAIPPTHQEFWSKGYEMLEKGIDNKLYNVINRSDFLQKEFQLLDKFRDVKYKNWYRLTNQHQMNPISRESILAYRDHLRRIDLQEYFKIRDDNDGIRADFKSRLEKLSKTKTVSGFRDNIDAIDDIIKDFEKGKNDLNRTHDYLIRESKVVILTTIMSMMRIALAEGPKALSEDLYNELSAILLGLSSLFILKELTVEEIRNFALNQAAKRSQFIRSELSKKSQLWMWAQMV